MKLKDVKVSGIDAISQLKMKVVGGVYYPEGFLEEFVKKRNAIILQQDGILVEEIRDRWKLKFKSGFNTNFDEKE